MTGTKRNPGGPVLPPMRVEFGPGMTAEHPVRCAATTDAPLAGWNHTHHCVHPAPRPGGAVGVLEHQCSCGATWTERTDAVSWDKVKLTVSAPRHWWPVSVEVLEDAYPEWAAQFVDHRGPGHLFGLIRSALGIHGWRCARCHVGGDL